LCGSSNQRGGSSSFPAEFVSITPDVVNPPIKSIDNVGFFRKSSYVILSLEKAKNLCQTMYSYAVSKRCFTPFSMTEYVLTVPRIKSSQGQGRMTEYGSYLLTLFLKVIV